MHWRYCSLAISHRYGLPSYFQGAPLVQRLHVGLLTVSSYDRIPLDYEPVSGAGVTHLSIVSESPWLSFINSTKEVWIPSFHLILLMFPSCCFSSPHDRGPHLPVSRETTHLQTGAAGGLPPIITSFTHGKHHVIWECLKKKRSEWVIKFNSLSRTVIYS